MSRLPLAALAASLWLAAGCTAQPDCKGTAQVCAGSCVELKSDSLNCGACGNACAAGEVCSAGACQVSCQAGLAECSGVCVDTQRDGLHCGACGSTCAAGQACSLGQCVTSCPAGEYACAGRCVDPQSDPSFCGAASDCSGGVACGPGQACHAAACVDLACTWQQVYFADLASLPPGAVLDQSPIGGQGPQVVYGRTAWYVTGDWNLLEVPATLAASDDVFAVEVDVYLPAGSTTTEQRAGIFLFNDPAPGSFGAHGILSTLQSAGETANVLRWWAHPLPSGAAGAFDQTTPITFVPSQWHTMRVEGQRSACRFRAFIDGSPVDAWSGACDTAGAWTSLYSRNDAVQPTNVAFSNLRILKGRGPGCVP